MYRATTLASSSRVSGGQRCRIASRAWSSTRTRTRKPPSRHRSSAACLRSLERARRTLRIWRAPSCASSNIHTHTHTVTLITHHSSNISIHHNRRHHHHRRCSRGCRRRDSRGWGMECMSMPLRSELFRSSGKEKRSEEADSPYPTYLTVVEVCPWRGASVACKAGQSCIKRSSSSSGDWVGETQDHLTLVDSGRTCFLFPCCVSVKFLFVYYLYVCTSCTLCFPPTLLFFVLSPSSVVLAFICPLMMTDNITLL